MTCDVVQKHNQYHGRVEGRVAMDDGRSGWYIIPYLLHNIGFYGTRSKACNTETQRYPTRDDPTPALSPSDTDAWYFQLLFNPYFLTPATLAMAPHEIFFILLVHRSHKINQAVSSVIASTLMAGGVTVFAGVDELPKVSLAVLAESLQAVLLCLHAGQEKVLINGEEVSGFSRGFRGQMGARRLVGW